MDDLTTINGAAKQLGFTPMRMHRFVKAHPAIVVYKLNSKAFLVSLESVKAELVKAGLLSQERATGDAA